MIFIDIVEMYGNGDFECLVGEVIKGCRDEVFLVLKVYFYYVGLDMILKVCENSLKWFGIDYLDLYFFYWRGCVFLEEIIEGMEKLCEEGKVLRWGVFNFDMVDMEELWNIMNGKNCVMN